jgi:hypothetical protein
MKKRFKNWIKYLFIRYIPGTNQLAALEAKRLSDYIVDNYSESQQIIILDDMKANVIIRREQQIIDQKELINKENKRLNSLSANLLTLTQ